MAIPGRIRTALPVPWKKIRRMRKGRKIHNTLVTNYVRLARSRSPGVCAAWPAWKPASRAIRGYPEPTSHSDREGGLGQEERGSASIFLHSLRVRGGEKMEKRARRNEPLLPLAVFSRGFLGCIPGITERNYAAASCRDESSEGGARRVLYSIFLRVLLPDVTTVKVKLRLGILKTYQLIICTQSMRINVNTIYRDTLDF